jgi:hypothetical protein
MSGEPLEDGDRAGAIPDPVEQETYRRMTLSSSRESPAAAATVRERRTWLRM